MKPPPFLSLLFVLPLPCLMAQESPEIMQPEDTEVWNPTPPVISATAHSIPSDAVVLFDGTDLNAWESESGGPANWEVQDGLLTVTTGPKGGIVTKEAFSDCQLHVEWKSPNLPTGEGQMRGNSGIFFMGGRYEVQILDSYNNPTYVNGQAASVYKQYAPLVNASRPPGEWQSYDIVFTAPRFNTDGSLKAPAFVTMLHNGVLVQDHVELQGITRWIGLPEYDKHAFELPISLQDHGCSVAFRNIWIRRCHSQELLNRSNLDDWYSFLEHQGYEDPNGNFSIENGVLHILGKDFGYLATKESFQNYHLRAEFKWGEAQWPPRETGKRDSGILYHFADGVADSVWPKSIECQVQEGDCGDIWCVGTQLESPNADEQAWGMKHVFRTEDFEKPNGEWNVVEVIANGNAIEHWVNGHLVNTGTRTDVAAGRILLQSEGAEIYYRSVRITPF
ncbi:MAG: DUF1080 domain-containing protein [Opitutales bacterium]|nr:DUF1080 domain-containing protein [Opitutales bacterium]